jgi:hypothetical protein
MKKFLKLITLCLALFLSISCFAEIPYKIKIINNTKDAFVMREQFPGTPFNIPATPLSKNIEPNSETFINLDLQCVKDKSCRNVWAILYIFPRNNVNFDMFFNLYTFVRFGWNFCPREDIKNCFYDPTGLSPTKTIKVEAEIENNIDIHEYIYDANSITINYKQI